MNTFREKVKANLTVSNINGSQATSSSQSSLSSADVCSKEDVTGNDISTISQEPSCIESKVSLYEHKVLPTNVIMI